MNEFIALVIVIAVCRLAWLVIRGPKKQTEVTEYVSRITASLESEMTATSPNAEGLLASALEDRVNICCRLCSLPWNHSGRSWLQQNSDQEMSFFCEAGLYHDTLNRSLGWDEDKHEWFKCELDIRQGLDQHPAAIGRFEVKQNNDGQIIGIRKVWISVTLSAEKFEALYREIMQAIGMQKCFAFNMRSIAGKYEMPSSEKWQEYKWVEFEIGADLTTHLEEVPMDIELENSEIDLIRERHALLLRSQAATLATVEILREQNGKISRLTYMIILLALLLIYIALR